VNAWILLGLISALVLTAGGIGLFVQAVNRRPARRSLATALLGLFGLIVACERILNGW